MSCGNSFQVSMAKFVDTFVVGAPPIFGGSKMKLVRWRSMCAHVTVG